MATGQRKRFEAERRKRFGLDHRFLTKVAWGETLADCDLWRGKLNSEGYGTFVAVICGVRVTRAHVAAYVRRFGPLPSGKEIVCHTCDVRRCVNPAHLWAGTHQENRLDMRRKGRQPRRPGEAHHRAKLTEADVREMRRLKAAGASLGELASQFGTSKSNCSLIVRHMAWGHVRDAGSPPARLPLTDENVREMRRRHDRGATQAELARIYDVSSCMASKIVGWEAWTHVLGSDGRAVGAAR